MIMISINKTEVSWPVLFFPVLSDPAFWYPDEYNNVQQVEYSGVVVREFKNFWGTKKLLVKCTDGRLREVSLRIVTIKNYEEKSFEGIGAIG